MAKQPMAKVAATFSAVMFGATYQRCTSRDSIYRYRCQKKSGHDGQHWCNHGRSQVTQWNNGSQWSNGMVASGAPREPGPAKGEKP